ncbi:DRAP deaminase [Rhizopus microsporus var. microsporus]|uniref:Pseudouridine synthase n=2 Tax=Rhizopus microsporus TaxID=58291 RepID=A0A2G4TAM1_RHIZD|nr:DRAP deaminase [Rhizopus microsporus ATCC 52813]ORE06521.1 DRAP deaminase [Rhizopus microsporus var. microsporus]PHZ17746.1 DRAP deaminase [Rhizopus microsporus ATCC 52813]
MLIVHRWLKSISQKRCFSTKLENDVAMAEYYFENGLRKVKPYYYDFHAYVKPRMIGKSILDAYVAEYRGRSELYYRYAIRKELITVNHKKVECDTVLQHNDLVIHRVHRHEPPVTDQDVKVVYEDEGLVVINKPGSIQVHPGGRYRHNTAVHILMKEKGYDRLFPINRLDRSTSGLTLIAKSSQRAAYIKKELRERTIEKEYICRVMGKFPSQQIVCDAPIKQLAYEVPYNYVHPDGKDCTTVFDRISFNGRTSIVRCRPVTGRTHQIRVHLRYLGYPIANDPIYGFLTPWSDLLPSSGSVGNTEAIIQSMIHTTPDDYMKDPFDESDLPRCQECNVPIIQTDPTSSQLALWLHAVKYTASGWSYESPLPEWANSSFKDDDLIIPASHY